MSIYGPPSPPPRDHARKASAHGTRVVLWVIVLGALTCVGVLGLLEFQRSSSSSERLEVPRAGASRVGGRLHTAELMPAIPPPPPIAIPEPRIPGSSGEAAPAKSQIAEPTRSSSSVAGEAAPAKLQVAEPLPGPLAPVEPARMQTAEILR